MASRTTVSPDAWRRLIRAVFERDGYRCLLCRKRATAGNPLQAHHVLKRSQGGADARANLATLHARGCHPAMDGPGAAAHASLLRERILENEIRDGKGRG